jgi:SynChlorMet cassette protein ScmC
VKKLAAILQLKEGESEDGHLMFFSEKLPEPRFLAGWTKFKHSIFQVYLHPGLHHVIWEYDLSYLRSAPYVLMWDAMRFIQWECMHLGGLPFHAALLEYRGQGVILAAQGETGKSTCSRRVPPPWRARCDDEVLVVLSPEGRYLAHPFPTWTDYILERAENTWKVEEAIPLAGIFFLEQSPEDECLPLRGAESAVAAMSSAGQNMNRFLRFFDDREARKIKKMILDNACEIVKHIPAFSLRVSLTGCFWEKIEAALGWR